MALTWGGLQMKMPNKDGTGPKGHGPKDGHGKGQGKGKGNNPGQGPMTGGKTGINDHPKSKPDEKIGH